MTKISIDTLGGLRLELYAEATADAASRSGTPTPSFPSARAFRT